MEKMTQGKAKWPLFVIGAVVLVLVAAVLCLCFLGNGDPDATAQTQPTESVNPNGELKLYWNVERTQYYGNRDFTRHADSEGYVGMTFAVDGQQVRMKAASLAVANEADAHEVMGLVFDEQGVIIDVLDVHECVGGYAAYHYYV